MVTKISLKVRECGNNSFTLNRDFKQKKKFLISMFVLITSGTLELWYILRFYNINNVNTSKNILLYFSHNKWSDEQK